MPTTTQRLEAQLAEDVDRAFPALVRAHVDGLYSGVLRLTHDPADTEDIVQDTFVRAHKALHGYSPQRRNELKLAAWLWTIALNLCRNRVRGRSRRPNLVSLSTVAERSSGDDPAAEALEIVDDAWHVRLGELHEAERDAIVLRHVVGLSYKEISAALERKPGTVKSDVHRGLERLRQIIEREGSSAA